MSWFSQSEHCWKLEKQPDQTHLCVMEMCFNVRAKTQVGQTFWTFVCCLLCPVPFYVCSNVLGGNSALICTDGRDNAEQSRTVSGARQVGGTGWAYSTAECIWGCTYNKPVLCMFVSVLMSEKEAVAFPSLFQPLAKPFRPNCGSSRRILHII